MGRSLTKESVCEVSTQDPENFDEEVLALVSAWCHACPVAQVTAGHLASHSAPVPAPTHPMTPGHRVMGRCQPISSAHRLRGRTHPMSSAHRVLGRFTRPITIGDRYQVRDGTIKEVLVSTLSG